MKKLLLLSTLIVASLSHGQDYSRVRVHCNHMQRTMLIEQGIPLDHGKVKHDTWIETDLSIQEINHTRSQGIVCEILIEDVQEHYAQQLAQPQNRNLTCSGGGGSSASPTVPANFALGSMGGYLTYQEYLDNVDSMSAKYPNLISARSAVGSFTTFEGRSLYWMRISDNPNTDESGEPEILYTAIHHAREPASLSQLVFYMWYLLENYDTDPEVQYLVNNTEMYFIPMLNPDGYIYNENTNPNGGGMWRKNRRNNGGGAYGVDLNRNYSWEWGMTGASSNPSNDTYKGTAPFSEPETQAVKWFCENHEFIFGSNAHTNGDQLLHPFGWSNSAFVPEHDYYTAITTHMVEHNGFQAMKSSYLYEAAGDSDDWMYADDLGTKPRIFSMTPEIGPDSYGFWPPSSQITPICQSTLFMNMRLPHLAMNYALNHYQGPLRLSSTSGHLPFEIQRLGRDSADFIVSITPIQGFSTVGSPVTISAMSQMEQRMDSISFTLDAAIQGGDPIVFVLNTDMGGFIYRDTISLTYLIPTMQFFDDGSSMMHWLGSQWNVTNEDSYSPSTSITDSPLSNYSNQTTSTIELDTVFNLTNASSPMLTFWAKWDIEADYDYVQLQVSTDGGASWIPQCGLYTVSGTNNQDPGAPLWDGQQTSWVQEEISLSDYIGQQMRLRFVLESDWSVNGDGFYFDDLSIHFEQSVGIDETESTMIQAFPNPSNSSIRFSGITTASMVTLRDAAGKVVLSRSIAQGEALDVESLQSGLYFWTLTDQGDNQHKGRVQVIH